MLKSHPRVEVIERRALPWPGLHRLRLVRLVRVGPRLICLGLGLAVGCFQTDAPPADQQPPDTSRHPPRQSVSLSVVVVNDAPLATAIARLRGEWTAAAGVGLEASSISLPDLLNQDQPPGDLLVYPTRYLGELAERGWLRPVRRGVLAGELFDEADVFAAVRHRLIRYNGQVLALPLGVQLSVLAFREDALQEAGERVPTTWADYDATAARVARQRGDSDESWPAAIEPWDGAGAYSLLLRAAAYATYRAGEGILFDPTTMDARITEPPFSRALSDIVALSDATARAAIDSRQVARDPIANPHEAVTALAAGRALMAVGFPSSNAEPGAAAAPGTHSIRWSELPGTQIAYRASLDEWESVSAGVLRVPVLGLGGRMASVCTSSRNSAAAFRLLAWFSSSEISAQLGPTSGEAFLFRRSQVASAHRWLPDDWGRSQARELARTVESTLNRQQCLVIPRIPGIDDYLAALERAVEQARSGAQDVEEALDHAAAAWNQITARLGLATQREAYRRHLDLAD